VEIENKEMVHIKWNNPAPMRDPHQYKTRTNNTLAY